MDCGGSSIEELTARLFIKLQFDGSLSQLTPELKSKLIEFLNETSQEDHSKNDKLEPKFPFEITNWLVAEHLYRNSLISTLSVFNIECGHSQIRKLFNMADVLAFMGVDLKSVDQTKDIVQEYNDKGCNLFLWKLLMDIKDWNKHKLPTYCEKEIQTEAEYDGVTSSVEFRLQQIDAVYSKRKAELPLPKFLLNNDSLHGLDFLSSLQAFPGFMSDVRTVYDDRVKMVQRQDQEHCRQEMDHFRKSMEEFYQKRLDGLVQRERGFTEALERQKMLIEEELFRQRQQILCDLSSFKQQQDRWEQQRSNQERNLKYDFERLDQLKKDLNNRDILLNEREEKYDAWLIEQRQLIEMKIRMDYNDRLRKVTARENELDQVKKSLLEMEHRLASKQAEYADANKKSLKLQAELTKMIDDVEYTKKRNAEILEQRHKENEQLKRELRLLEERFHNVVTKTETEAPRQSSVVFDVTDRFERPHLRDVASLRQELQRLKNEQQGEKEAWLWQKRQLEEKLNKVTTFDRILSDRLKQQYQHTLSLYKAIDEIQEKQSNNKVVQNMERGQEVSSMKRTSLHLQDTSLQGDLHETYFDTTLNASQIPPELELESNIQRLHLDTSLLDSARSRIKTLELEANDLEKSYKTFKKSALSPPEKIHDLSLVESPLIFKNISAYRNTISDIYALTDINQAGLDYVSSTPLVKSTGTVDCEYMSRNLFSKKTEPLNSDHPVGVLKRFHVNGIEPVSEESSSVLLEPHDLRIRNELFPANSFTESRMQKEETSGFSAKDNVNEIKYGIWGSIQSNEKDQLEDLHKYAENVKDVSLSLDSNSPDDICNAIDKSMSTVGPAIVSSTSISDLKLVHKDIESTVKPVFEGELGAGSITNESQHNRKNESVVNLDDAWKVKINEELPEEEESSMQDSENKDEVVPVIQSEDNIVGGSDVKANLSVRLDNSMQNFTQLVNVDVKEVDNNVTTADAIVIYGDSQGQDQISGGISDNESQNSDYQW